MSTNTVLSACEDGCLLLPLPWAVFNQEPVPGGVPIPSLLAYSILLQHLSVVVLLLAIALHACVVLLVLDNFQVIVVIHLTSMILLGAEGTARKGEK